MTTLTTRLERFRGMAARASNGIGVDDVGLSLAQFGADQLFVDGIRDLLSLCADAVAAVPEWRPISEAPRDGTIIAALWRMNHPVSDGSYSMTKFYRGQWVNLEDYDDTYREPSHFMLLPQPPEPSAGSKDVSHE